MLNSQQSDNRMNILIPYDITTTGMKNPYLFLLMRELVKQDLAGSVQHGYGWLYEPGEFDVVHLHWPELLVKSQLPDMSRTDLIEQKHFDKVIRAVDSRKNRGTSFVITIHNEKPHKDKKGKFEAYFRDLYNLMDGFIHMGESSKTLLEKNYPEETAAKPSFIIPHGDYSYFANDLDRSDCRKRLNIKPDQKLLLAFGAIRNERELNLGIDAFKQASVENAVYMMAGSLPYPYKSQHQHFSVRKKLYANIFNDSIRTAEKQIGPDAVQLYLKSADLVFIPRFNTLNSGNVALAFTFGKVVAGPDYGVIGETLRATGNPVFDPFVVDSAAEAIREGFRLAGSGHDKKNREFAERDMSWDSIARKTANAYLTVYQKS